MLIGILGGGLSGVSLQRFLRGESEVLEKEERPGGLCRTFSRDGFYYDIGGHILFSKNTQIMRLVRKFLGSNANLCRRNVKVLFKGRFIKYPFENGLGELDKEDNYECLIGYLRNDYRFSRTFEGWIYKTFGKGIAEKYLIPYNQKIWKFPLENMGCEWVERIPKPPLEDVVKSSLGIDTEGYTHQLYFNYPKQGGIEALVKSLIKNPDRVVTNFAINKIKKEKKHWLVGNGKIEKRYARLVLTIPLQEAIKCLEKVPGAVLRAVNNLKYNSVRTVLVGINNGSLLDKGAVYVPDASIIFHRICFPGYFSRYNVPRGTSAVVAEISTNRNNKLRNYSDAGLIQRTVKDLERLNILRKKDVVTTQARNFEYAYVVYDSNYTKNMKIIRRYFSALGIELLGRFAEFEYINMDEVFRRSRVLAEKLNSLR